MLTSRLTAAALPRRRLLARLAAAALPLHEMSLRRSQEQALRSAPPLTAPVPVWADGPDSGHLGDEVAADAAPGFAALQGDGGDFGIQTVIVDHGADQAPVAALVEVHRDAIDQPAAPLDQR